MTAQTLEELNAELTELKQLLIDTHPFIALQLQTESKSFSEKDPVIQGLRDFLKRIERATIGFVSANTRVH